MYHAVQHSFALGGRAKLCGIKTMGDQIDYHGWAQTMLNSMIFEYHAVQHDGSSDWDDVIAACLRGATLAPPLPENPLLCAIQKPGFRLGVGASCMDT